MIDLHPKHFVQKRMKAKHGIELHESQLQEIDEVYFQSRKENVQNIYYYRIVNLIFSIIAICLWFLVSGTWFEKPFFLFSTIAFGLLNFLKAFMLRRKLKRLNGR